MENKEIEDLFFNSTSMDQLPKIEPTAMGNPDADVAVLCQHGFIGSNLDLMLIGNSLVKQGYRVILPILPGHGSNYRDLHGIKYSSWVDSLTPNIEFLREEKPGRKIFLLGHSLGGSISLIHASKRDDITGVISISAPVGYHRSVHGITKILGSTLPRAKITYKEFIFDDKRLFDNPYIRFLNENYGKVTISTLKQVIYLVEDTHRALQHVKVPVLIIHSTKDDTVPFSNAERIFEEVGSEIKELVRLDTSYHIVVADTDKEKVIEETLGFIQKILEIDH